MRFQQAIQWPALALATAFLAAAPLPHARGDKIIFGDGFVIEGRVKEKMTILQGPVPIAVPKAGEPYWLDDGVRNIYFPPFQLKEALKDRTKKADQITFVKASPSPRDPLPPNWKVERFGTWDERWERDMILDLGNGKKLTVKQRITSLTPEGIRVEALSYDWVSYFHTKECDPETLRRLVYQGIAKKEPKDLDRRLTIYQFFMQAGLTEQAETELGDMLREYPQEESKIAPLLGGIKRMIALEVVEAVMRSDAANLHGALEKSLEHYAKRQLRDLLGEKTQLQIQTITDRLQATKDKLGDARRLLAAFAELTPPKQREFFKKAAADIAAELNHDTVGRLDTFLNLAGDFERAVKDKRQPEQGAAEVMAFALTGWLRGSNAAEHNVDVAVKQWETRQLLLDYLRCDDPLVRKNNFLPPLKEKTNVDEAMQILRQLPPVEGFSQISAKPQQLQTRNNGKPVTYELQLPPGYHHGRHWPVLMVLHFSQEKPAEAVARWTELAAAHGYIVAAPHWSRAPKNVEYQFTAGEHAAVLETLRDLRRRFQIDSDRVFFGAEQGADMAFDVGLAHPDQFAGVMPMSGTPRFFAQRYWPNAQHLHLYIINGERAGSSSKETHAVFKNFTKGNFPAIYVEYKGRRQEWFGAEQPTLFKWMDCKRRAHPIAPKELCRNGQDYLTQRTTDTQFYWLSTANVLPNHINTKAGWNTNIRSGTLKATLFANNEIHVVTTGVGPVTLWFGPKFVNYQDKVAIKVNGGAVVKVAVTPNLETLLETLYQTGDRQRLYFARVDWK